MSKLAVFAAAPDGFTLLAGVELTHVPYKGTGPAQHFAAFLAADRARWSSLMREANIRAE